MDFCYFQNLHSPWWSKRQDVWVGTQLGRRMWVLFTAVFLKIISQVSNWSVCCGHLILAQRGGGQESFGLWICFSNFNFQPFLTALNICYLFANMLDLGIFWHTFHWGGVGLNFSWLWGGGVKVFPYLRLNFLQPCPSHHY